MNLLAPFLARCLGKPETLHDGQTIEETLRGSPSYKRQVFVAPPWRHLFSKDDERRHDFDEAVREHLRIVQALDALGYIHTQLPKVSVEERAEFMLKECGAH